MAGKTLGHIDCPTCGTKAGMRITHDKNGDPFGYCEATCSQQMRVGGSADRVRRFVARFPWAAKPVTDTDTGAPAKPAHIEHAKPAPAAAPAPAKPEQKPAASPVSGLASALQAFGIK